MATTKLGNTKQASRAINYAEKRAVEKSGLNCDVNYAKSVFKKTRELYGKNNGIQAHTVIQSFKPGEVTAKLCNQLGLELAQKIAPNHQVTVYTHDDKDHMHNHIVINSVDIETGQKYQSNKKQRELVKQMNDEVCKTHGLSVVTRQNASTRYSQAELEIDKKGKQTWKEELRQSIDLSKRRNNDFEGFQEDLGTFGIEIKLRGSTVSYKHPDEDKWVRAKKLGSNYELEGLEIEFTRQTKSRETETDKQSRTTWRDFERETDEQQHRNRRIEEAKRITERQNARNRKIADREKQHENSSESQIERPVRKARENDRTLEL